MSRTKVKQNLIDASFGNILEQLVFIADGSSITTSRGTITAPNVTSAQGQNSTSFADITGTDIAYLPPVGSTRVVYECEWVIGYNSSAHPLPHIQILLDGTVINHSRYTHYNGGNSGPYDDRITNKAIIIINSGAPDDIANGKLNAWSSNKTIKMQGANWSGHNFYYHYMYHWDNNTTTRPIIQPTIKLTAYS